jgi:hypothetical protein
VASSPASADLAVGPNRAVEVAPLAPGTSTDLTLSRPVNPLACISYAMSAVALGLLVGTGPVLGILPAAIGIVGGVVSSIRLRLVHAGQRGRGLAVAAIVIGTISGGISLLAALGSAPV